VLRSRLTIIAVSALVAVGCGGGGEGGSDTSASAVAANPEAFFGDEVTIEAPVSNPIDHRVWEVAEGRLFVIFDRGLDRGLEQGERLRVSGTVRPLERSVIEGELGIDIEGHFFDDAFLEDDVALVADEVTRLQPP
jgi:hypothetical protein